MQKAKSLIGYNFSPLLVLFYPLYRAAKERVIERSKDRVSRYTGALVLMSLAD
jgi:hypothetical protein